MLKHANKKHQRRLISSKPNFEETIKKEWKMDEIPVRIAKHTKWISGITDGTKCVDIVTGVLMAESLLDVPESEVITHYALVEMWRGVTKVLNGNSPILRIWKAWADEQVNVCFVVKRIKNPKQVLTTTKDVKNYNIIEKMRAHVKEEELSQKTKKRVTRRNSSIHRQKKTPDTFHPNAVNKNKKELCESIEEKMRVMILQSEALKNEIYNLQNLNFKPSENENIFRGPEVDLPHKDRLRPRDQSQDTSEDSGIVTDDSEAKSAYENTKYFEMKKHLREKGPESEIKLNYKTSEVALQPPPNDPVIYEWVEAMDKINKLNKMLEQKEEQMIALQYEYNMLKSDAKDEPSPLDCFNTEVTKFREINAKLLDDITSNRKHIDNDIEDTNNSKKVINQLEFDINLVEREGKRLEGGLKDLENMSLLAEESNKMLPVPDETNNYIQLPKTLTNMQENLDRETTLAMAASTLV